jgi:hypothetical protein
LIFDCFVANTIRENVLKDSAVLLELLPSLYLWMKSFQMVFFEFLKFEEKNPSCGTVLENEDLPSINEASFPSSV